MLLENKHVVQSIASGKVVKERVESLSPHRLCTLCLPDQIPLLGSSSCEQAVISSSTIGTSKVATAVLTDDQSSLPPQDDSSSSGTTKWHLPIVGMAPCDPIIAFETYVLVATIDCRVCVYTLPQQQRHRQPAHDGETKDVFVLPIVVTNPLDTNNNNNTFTGVASIVAMCATPAGVSLISKNKATTRSTILGHVAVLTCEGCVYILEFIQAFSLTTPLPPPTVSVKISFHTGNVGATCLCIIARYNLTLNLEHHDIVVGHDIGIITCHEVIMVVKANRSDALDFKETSTKDKNKNYQFDNNDRNKNMDILQKICIASPSSLTTSTSTTTTSNVISEEELSTSSLMDELVLNSKCFLMTVRWRGSFGRSVASISPLGKIKSGQDTTETTVEDLLPSRFLAVGLNGFVACSPFQKFNNDVAPQEQYVSLQLSQHQVHDSDYHQQCAIPHVEAGCMEVIDLEMVEQSWKSSQGSMNAVSHYFNEDDTDALLFEEVDLKKFCIWPEVGMEIIETPSSACVGRKGKKTAVPQQQYPEIISAAPKFCTVHGDFNNEWILGSLSSSSIFSAIHAHSNDTNTNKENSSPAASNSLSWGLADKRNQMRLLSKGSIPISVYGLDLGLNEKSVACCMNDGTVFILPVMTISRLAGTTATTTDHVLPRRRKIIVFPYSSLDFADYEHTHNEEEHQHLPHYIQGFTAGACFCGPLSSASDEYYNRTMPKEKQNIYITAHACGFLDVFYIGEFIKNFSCSRKSSSEADNLIQHLIQNGTVRLLLDELARSQCTRCKESNMAWKLAANECFPVVNDELKKEEDAVLLLSQPSAERIEEIITDLNAGANSSMTLTKSLIFKIASGTYP